MYKKRRKDLKEKGITLVALVVTVIVLLILAGVTISLALGSNGVIEKAQYASNSYANAAKDERRAMEEMTNEVARLSQRGSEEELGDGSGGGGSSVDFTITDSGVKSASLDTAVTPLSTSATKTLADNKGNLVKVPKNFGIAYDSADNVAEGIVIEYTGTSDSDPLKGNQYVWVPVGQAITKTDGTTMPAITLGRYDFDAYPNSTWTGVEGTGTATLVQDSANWQNTTETSAITQASPGLKYEFEKNDTAGSSYGSTKANDLEGFINSANSNHGYYIARYEAGSGASNSKAYTQKNKPAWVSITQSNAAAACQNMYEGANSDLINSYAWDTAVVYIQNATGNTAYSKQNRGANTSKVNTGITGDEQCKINDMAKNVTEWTTESSTYSYGGNNYCVVRGGFFGGDAYCTADRGSAGANESFEENGFRSLMYL